MAALTSPAAPAHASMATTPVPARGVCRGRGSLTTGQVRTSDSAVGDVVDDFPLPARGLLRLLDVRTLWQDRKVPV